MIANALYDHLGLPEASRLDKRIYKRTVLEHGQLTNSDKKILSDDVSKLTWRFALKAGTVHVLPYEDGDREYLEVAIIEAVLSSSRRSSRIAEMIQRAIPYPVLLVMVERTAFCTSVAHKRFSRSEEGRIVAEDFLSSPWIKPPLSDRDRAFCDALAMNRLSQVDFFALYGSMVGAVLASMCAQRTGRFVLDNGLHQEDRRQKLERCQEIEREIISLRAAIPKETQFAEQVGLNTRINELEARLARTEADL